MAYYTNTGVSQAYSRALSLVDQELGLEDVQILTTIIPELSTRQREEMKTGRSVFRELEKQEQLGPKNVEKLINWLKELKRNKAASILEDYRCQHYGTAEKDGPQESPTECLAHDKAVKKYFCVSCCEGLCPECVIHGHKTDNHVVIELSQIKQTLVDYRNDLRTKIERLNNSNTSNDQERENYYKGIREKIQENYQEISQRLNMEFFAMLDVTDTQRMNERLRLGALDNSMKGTIRDMMKILQDNLTESVGTVEALTQLKALEEQTEDVRAKLEQGVVDITANSDNLLFFDVSKKESIMGKIIRGDVVGANWVRDDPHQMIRVFDERKSKGMITLLCISPKDSQQLFWDYALLEASNTVLVMSNRSIHANDTNQMLIATGQDVFLVQFSVAKFSKHGRFYDGVSCVQKTKLTCPKDDACITAIAAHRPSEDNCSEFLVAFSDCLTIYTYNIKQCEPFRSYDCSVMRNVKDFVGIAYKEPKFALVDSQTRNITFLESSNSNGMESTKHIRLEIIQTLDRPKNLFPKVIYSADNTWLLLWQSTHHESSLVWNIVGYAMGNVGEKKEFANGTFELNDVPVGICRYRKDALLCFSGGKLCEFKLK